MSSPFGMAVPPATPFAGSLFKSRDEGQFDGPPVQPQHGGSPFASPGATPPPTLTVGDVLAQLPPDLVRANYLPADQPISIPQPLMDAALSNGQAAIPIFEIYRVCPALFQVPISPQDTRMVPLPAGKLPTMIAASQSAGRAPTPFGQMPASPFGAPVQSPFGAPNLAEMQSFGAPALPPQVEERAKTGTLLPPRREPGTLPFATMNSGHAQSHALPSAFPSQPQQPISPFGSMPSMPAPQAAASPFSMEAPAQNPAPPASPFAFSVPDAAPQPPAIPGASPFGVQPAQPEGGPISALFKSKQPSPFGSNPPSDAGAPAVSPFGQAAPQPFALTEPPPPPPVQAAPPPQPAIASIPGGPIKLSLASILKGYSVNDLGFDPGIIPSWIVTQIPSAAIQNQSASGKAEVELGLLIDGTTDVGFRNVLAAADRGVRIPISAQDLGGVPAPVQVAQPQPPTQPPQATLFSAPTPPQQAFEMRAPPPMQNPLASAAAPTPPPFEASPPAPPPPPPVSANPFAAARAAAIAQSGPLSPAARLAQSGPIQPKSNALFSFSAPVAPAELPSAATPPPVPAPATAPEFQSPPLMAPRQMTSFDPFAATSAAAPWAEKAPAPTFPPGQAGEGFSSEQLFGGPPAPVPAAPPMPSFPEPQKAAPTAPDMGFTVLPGIPPPAQFPQAPTARAETPMPNWGGPPTPPPVSLAPQPEAPKPAPFSFPAASPSGMGAPSALPPGFAAQAPGWASPPPVPEKPAAPASGPFAPVVALAAPQAPRPESMSSFGITPVTVTDAEQTMLRALLGVNEHLTVGRVVEIMARIPGVAACSCVSGSNAIAQGGSSGSAQDFQRQSAELARSVQALAPMIGIAGAETFSINTNDRLMTFSFHDPIAIGVLHQDSDLAAGLRDKITLVGRELARLVTKNGGHLS